MTSNRDSDANKPQTHGNSGEGSSSIVPHLPDPGQQQQQQPQPPKLQEPAAPSTPGTPPTDKR